MQPQFRAATRFGRLALPCEWCGEQFLVKLSDSAERRFCSRPCWRAWQRASLTRTVCAQCGRFFMTEAAVLARGKAKYCDRVCYAEARARPLAERFWAKVERSPRPDGCWMWTGSRDSNGYGQIYDRQTRRRLRATHVALGLTCCWPPAGVMVCHTCDHPWCVNPAHLWYGDHLSNQRDMWAKGRGPLGERHGSQTHPERTLRGAQLPQTRLLPAVVAEIRRLRALGFSQSAIAGAVGVAQASVSRALHGRLPADSR